MTTHFYKILTISLIGVFLFSTLFSTEANSIDDICPDDQTLNECYENLQDQQKELQERSKQLSRSISQEERRQMSLSEQVRQLEIEIERTENEITRIETQLEAKNVQIRILRREIDDIRNRITTLSQETGHLQDSISERVSISYKYSFLNPLEIFLQAEDADELFRKLKYLNEARKNDRELLQEMVEQNAELDNERDQLERSQLDLEETRMDIEDTKEELNEEEERLESQRAEHTHLLAQSKEKKEQQERELTEVEEQQQQVTAQISAMVQKMYQRGDIPVDRPVSEGDIIGTQGYTGFTIGSHLHLEVYNSSGGNINPLSQGLFSGGGLYNRVSSGEYHEPLAGGVLTGSYHSGHRALDLQSQTHGVQTGQQYYGEQINCYGMTRRAGHYNKRGTGAPIYAITDGYVSAVHTDACGGKYVILEHDDGGSSFYLHLQ